MYNFIFCALPSACPYVHTQNVKRCTCKIIWTNQGQCLNLGHFLQLLSPGREDADVFFGGGEWVWYCDKIYQLLKLRTLRTLAAAHPSPLSPQSSDVHAMTQNRNMQTLRIALFRENMSLFTTTTTKKQRKKSVFYTSMLVLLDSKFILWGVEDHSQDVKRYPVIDLSLDFCFQACH